MPQEPVPTPQGPALTIGYREVNGVADGCSPGLAPVHPWGLHLNAPPMRGQQQVAQVPEGADGLEFHDQRVVPITPQGHPLPLEDGGPGRVQRQCGLLQGHCREQGGGSVEGGQGKVPTGVLRVGEFQENSPWASPLP